MPLALGDEPMFESLEQELDLKVRNYLRKERPDDYTKLRASLVAANAHSSAHISLITHIINLAVASTKGE